MRDLNIDRIVRLASEETSLEAQSAIKEEENSYFKIQPVSLDRFLYHKDYLGLPQLS